MNTASLTRRLIAGSALVVSAGLFLSACTVPVGDPELQAVAAARVAARDPGIARQQAGAYFDMLGRRTRQEAESHDLNRTFYEALAARRSAVATSEWTPLHAAHEWESFPAPTCGNQGARRR